MKNCDDDDLLNICDEELWWRWWFVQVLGERQWQLWTRPRWEIIFLFSQFSHPLKHFLIPGSHNCFFPNSHNFEMKSWIVIALIFPHSGTVVRWQLRIASSAKARKLRRASGKIHMRPIESILSPIETILRLIETNWKYFESNWNYFETNWDLWYQLRLFQDRLRPIETILRLIKIIWVAAVVMVKPLQTISDWLRQFWDKHTEMLPKPISIVQWNRKWSHSGWLLYPRISGS